MVTLSHAKRSTALAKTWLSIFAITLLFGAATLKAAIDRPLTQDQKGPATIRLTDGSLIMGVVTGIRDDALQVKTAFSDADLAIHLSLVDSLKWQAETKLLLDDDRLVIVPALDVDGGKIDLGGQALPLIDIDIMNPADWEAGEGYHWTGDASMAFAFNRGNTETDEFDLKVNSVLESAVNRYTFNGHFERDEAHNRVVVGDREVTQSIMTADNWKLLGKYDHFLTDPINYLGANASLEADALAGVKLRTYAGPYYGRKLLDNDDYKLDGELGIAYVSTEYDADVNQEDNNYTGLNWNFTGESSILGGDSRLYLRHIGLIDISDSDQLILKNTLGLAFPLVYGLEAAAEMTINYDGTAAASREKVDEVYSFRVGYAW